MTGNETITLPDGSVRRLGNKEQPGGLTKAFPIYGQTPTAPMIARSQWKPVSFARFCSPIKDQDGQGACNAFNSVYLLEGCRRMQGLPDIRLSPGYLYGNINGGVDEGSYLEDAMAWLMNHGTCTAATVGELNWRTSPPAAAVEALNYRALEVYLCPTFDHMASAIQCGFWVSSGLAWFNNFNPDANGWLPKSSVMMVGGHAVARDGLAFDGSEWGLDGPNSWSASWGLAGRMVVRERHYSNQIGGFWAVRSVVDEGGQVPPVQA